MPDRQPNILIIDDDTQLRTMLAELLALENYQVETAPDGVAGLDIINQTDFDLIVLDVMMPTIDGFEVLKKLRQTHQTPVLMLTARGEASDRIIGLERGADDYLSKPFNPRELLLRIRAILKRSFDTFDHEQELVAGKLKIQPKTMSATLNDQPLSLTSAELRLLTELIRSPGDLVSREALTEQALGRELSPYDRALDTHISNLRSKLGKNELGESPIRSVRGEGYMLVVAD